MAKLGEGDQRWIVEERADGTNVHGWHWAERDLMGWSKQRLQELLGNKTLLDGDGSIWLQTTDLDSVTGEVAVNMRKGKIIPTYELSIKVKWEGEVKDGSGVSAGKASGLITIPYLADENSGEDPELTASTSFEGNVEQRCRQALLSKGKPVLYRALAQFVKEVEAGGPVQTKEEGPQAAAPRPATTVSKTASQQQETTAAKPQKSKSKGRTIELTQQFYARTADLFECFTHPGRIQAFTQSPATVDAKVGGEFTMFAGSILGNFAELSPPQRLVQNWRFKNWEDGVFSKVEIILEEPSHGTTVLKLKQTGIPDTDKFGNGDVLETTRNGWESQIFNRIRAVFGYGL